MMGLTQGRALEGEMVTVGAAWQGCSCMGLLINWRI